MRTCEASASLWCEGVQSLRRCSDDRCLRRTRLCGSCMSDRLDWWRESIVVVGVGWTRSCGCCIFKWCGGARGSERGGERSRARDEHRNAVLVRSAVGWGGLWTGKRNAAPPGLVTGGAAVESGCCRAAYSRGRQLCGQATRSSNSPSTSASVGSDSLSEASTSESASSASSSAVGTPA